VTGERGSALIGSVAIGFLFVLVIIQALLTIARLASASGEAADIAVLAAEHGARYADAGAAADLAHRLRPDAQVESTTSGSSISVVVELDVPLVGPEGSPVRVTVKGRATAPVSPYRSRP
jgi:antitoxin (DNA-binding transcriptional repressor) of toxin-antitoxin stability system